MRRGLIVVIINLLAVLADLAPVGAAQPLRTLDLLTPDQVLRWINGYRHKPDATSVPEVVKALSRMGAFKDPESSGAYVGFIAGVIGSERERAEELIGKMFPLPEENHWVIVRAIAYSAHPDWKHLLRVFAPRLPTRQVMIQKYLSNQSPTLFQVAARRSKTTGESVRAYFSYETYFGDGKKRGAREELEATPELLDTFWGYYFASGRYRPVARIVAMLPYANDGNSVELLTLGNMAKFTLASNAVRDTKLLGMLKTAEQQQPKPVASVLREVINAAETVETGRLRKEAMASIEELRRKGPAYRRDVSRWGQVGLGALSLGCIGAAALGQIVLGLPCVVGGALSQAGLRYWESQQ
ncbi:MAG: hypothetical protein IT536_19240 [Hyphomicrobiales bacterium]|nr:hypothetical protein [Hyphomicrobiales bacterium]